MSADRNLLFGVLALQMDFISRDQLIAAMNAWVFQKHQPLGLILLTHSALNADEHALLEALLNKHVERHGGNPGLSLSAVSTAGFVAADLWNIADVDVQASLASLSSSPPTHGGVEIPAVTGPWLDRVSASDATPLRFRILRPHAKGGLGEVFVAYDGELHREVALKEIKKGADQLENRSRFLLEAEITGGLEHPGIVPVYSLGRYGNGQPFYAMRFIKGESLSEAIRQFHAAEPGRPSPGQRPFGLRDLLGRFVDVCNAVAYAHSRGVMHRDLKPGNIMLGNYGETLVVDWGLAKAMGRSETEAELPERPLVPHSASGSAPTQMGRALGTPAYMSPEQAAGKLDKMSPASDVYSLGATLYQLLTGKKPVDGEDVGEVLRKVEDGAIQPVRQVKPWIAPGLEAICQKAMAMNPAERYANPKEMAADIEHWLADDPVSAYPEGWATKTRRWLGRHRTLATTAVAVALVALASLGIATALLEAANVRERKSRQRAEANFALARESVDNYFTAVSESPQLKARGLEKLRQQLLRLAMSFYERFASEHGGDLAIQAERGRTCTRLALISSELGMVADAIRHFGRAQEVFEELVREHPHEDLYQSELVRMHMGLGLLYQDRTMELTKAVQPYLTALTIQQPLALAHPDHQKYQADLAQLYNNLANIYMETGQVGEAEQMHQQALLLREQLARNSEVPAYQGGLAETYFNLGRLYLDFIGEPAKARAAHQKAIDFLEPIVQRSPTIPSFQRLLGRAYTNLGNDFWNQSQIAQARVTYEKALAVYQSLNRVHPDVPELGSLLALAYQNVGRVYFMMPGEHDKSEAAYRQALALQAPIARDNPESGQDQFQVAQFHHDLGTLYQRVKIDLPKAEVEFKAALEIEEPLVLRYPRIYRYQDTLGATYLNLGSLYGTTGRPARALESLDKALAVYQELARSYPKVSYFLQQLTAIHLARANHLVQIGKHAEAGREASAIVSAGGASSNSLYDVCCVYALCSATARNDVELAPAKRAALSDQYARQAVELLRQASAGGFRDTAHMKKDTDLDSLRSRADFLELLKQMESLKPGDAK